MNDLQKNVNFKLFNWIFCFGLNLYAFKNVTMHPIRNWNFFCLVEKKTAFKWLSGKLPMNVSQQRDCSLKSHFEKFSDVQKSLSEQRNRDRVKIKYVLICIIERDFCVFVDVVAGMAMPLLPRRQCYCCCYSNRKLFTKHAKQFSSDKFDEYI